MTNEHRPSDSDKQTGGVHIGDILGSIRGSIIAGRDVILGTTEQQRAMRNRRAMLELVRNTWIKGVLEQSLHGAAMIELGMEERADAVDCPWDMVVQMPNREDQKLPPGTKIIDVFDEMNGSLLILGEPGSGKTTMLLDLARDAIARVEENPTQPIPVVFNLSSWAEKRQPLGEWLVEELNTKYQIPKRIARPWIENDDLLLLLDGLDEVAEKHRDACVETINEFLQKSMMPLIVCSRVADYEALIKQLRLQGAVLLQPLTLEQIDQYLEGSATELVEVRKILQRQPDLQKLAQTPLMLNVMTIAYQGMPSKDLKQLSTTENCRRRVFDAYVRQMLERRKVEKGYSSEQTIEWLIWLARRMLQHNQSVFLIERMQPNWLQTSHQRYLYAIFSRAVTSVLVALMVGLLWGLPSLALGRVFQAGLFILFFAIGGLLTGLTIGLIAVNRLPREDIDVVESLEWSWVAVFDEMQERFYAWMARVRTPGEMYLTDLPVAFGVLVIKLTSALTVGLSSSDIEERSDFGIGIRNSIKYAMMVTLVGTLYGMIPGASILLAMAIAPTYSQFALGVVAVIVLIYLMSEVLPLRFPDLSLFALTCWGSSLVLAYALIGGLRFGGLAVIRHFVLRFILHFNSYIPWRLSRFLDYATERIFLRKVGGGYIFVHRLLQEYFASLYEEQHK